MQGTDAEVKAEAPLDAVGMAEEGLNGYVRPQAPPDRLIDRSHRPRVCVFDWIPKATQASTFNPLTYHPIPNP